MAHISRRLDALERDAVERLVEQRMEQEVEAMIDALERTLSPPEFQRALDALAKLDNEPRQGKR